MPTLEERHANYQAVSKAIEELGQEGIEAKLKAGKQVHEGVGGNSAVRLELGGVPVFAKRIPLTDLEAANPGSTKNLYDLPPHYQYGVGSAGFGAWREVEAHKMSTQWVLDGECPNFPLMYGSAIVARESQTMPDWMPEWLEKNWDATEGTPIFHRAKDQMSATKSVVVLLESMSQNLREYLAPHVFHKEGAGANSAPNMEVVTRELKATCDFMASKGMIHFDAHDGNILVDAEGHLRFGDFGLATSCDFELSVSEREFFNQHQSYDHSLAFMSLCDAAKGEKVASGEFVAALTEVVEAAKPYEAVGAKMKSFMKEVRADKSVRYPAAEMQHQFEAVGEDSKTERTWVQKMAEKAAKGREAGGKGIT